MAYPVVLLIQRYILRSLVRNFALLVVVLTAVLFLVLMGKDLMGDAGVGLGMLLSRFPYLLPPALALAMPLALLIGTLLTYGRMSADNEILALRMGGIHPGVALQPAILLGLFLAGVSVFSNGTLVPLSELRVRAVTKDDFRAFLRNLERQRSRSFSSRQLVLAWKDVDEEGWLRGLGFRLEPEEAVPVEGEADRARISFLADTEELLIELRGVTLVRGQLADRAVVEEKRLVYPIASLFETPSAGDKRQLLTSSQLLYRIHRDPLLGHPPDSKRLRKFRGEFWLRIWLGFSCLVFVLVGAPLGILFRRGSFVGAAFLALLLAFVAYYPLHQLGKSLSFHSGTPAVLAMAIPDLVLGGFGLFLLVRVFAR